MYKVWVLIESRMCECVLGEGGGARDEKERERERERGGEGMQERGMDAHVHLSIVLYHTKATSFAALWPQAR